MAAPYPWTGSWISTAEVSCTCSEVPATALLLMTRISSTTPSPSKSRMTFLMESRSLNVGSIRLILFCLYMVAARASSLCDDEHLLRHGTPERGEIELRYPIGLGQQGLEAERQEPLLQPQDPIAPRQQEVAEADVRKGFDVSEVVPVLAIAVIVVGLDYDDSSGPSQPAFEPIEQRAALLVGQVLQQIAGHHDVDRIPREVQPLLGPREQELHVRATAARHVRIGIGGILGRRVYVVDEVAVSRPEVQHGAVARYELLEVLADGLPDPAPARIR